ncbi:MAG TPA: hypothetical protein VEQ84_06705 [Vicinamibacteria bacterium]|nr:hypothetical protein [Vicinamibacteria bacterium]
MRTRVAALAAAGLALGVAHAGAEPIFLARQYARCTTCHFSPTGGGLLTPYGRSLTRQELSTTGGGHGPAPGSGPSRAGEEGPLFGLLGDSLGPVSVGIDLRPSHLDVRFPAGKDDRNLLMNAAIWAAFRAKGWTMYGELGRQPLRSGTRVDSFEHWVGYQSEKGLGFRAGRFLPAYGIRFADHTAFNRRPLGLDTVDQIYGVELSHTTDRHLIQVAAAPGRADSIIHDDGTRGFVASARFQLDLSTRMVLVASGLLHGASRLDARNGSAGLALGFSPVRRLTIWTEGDAQFQQGLSGAPSYVLVNETGFEVYRGVWLKVSPQLRTDFGDTSGGTFRLAFELNVLPRTHWNIDLSHYRDKGRTNDIVTRTTLLQLHLYL